MDIDRIEKQNKAMRAALILIISIASTMLIAWLSGVSSDSMISIGLATILAYVIGYLVRDTE